MDRHASACSTLILYTIQKLLTYCVPFHQ